MKLKMNVVLLGHPIGSVITVPDRNGVPVDRFWRNRVRDSKVDSCVTVMAPKAKPKAKPKPKKTKK